MRQRHVSRAAGRARGVPESLRGRAQWLPATAWTVSRAYANARWPGWAGAGVAVVAWPFWLMVHTASWLAGELVAISPHAVLIVLDRRSVGARVRRVAATLTAFVAYLSLFAAAAAGVTSMLVRAGVGAGWSAAVGTGIFIAPAVASMATAISPRAMPGGSARRAVLEDLRATTTGPIWELAALAAWPPHSGHARQLLTALASSEIPGSALLHARTPELGETYRRYGFTAHPTGSTGLHLIRR